MHVSMLVRMVQSTSWCEWHYRITMLWNGGVFSTSHLLRLGWIWSLPPVAQEIATFGQCCKQILPCSGGECSGAPGHPTMPPTMPHLEDLQIHNPCITFANKTDAAIAGQQCPLRPQCLGGCDPQIHNPCIIKIKQMLLIGLVVS